MGWIMHIKNNITMKPLKFVMTTTFYPPYHIGGDAMHVYHLSNELAKLGHEVHVIHSIDSYRWQRKNEPSHEYPNHENVIVHSIKSPIGKVSPLISYIFGSPYPVTKKIRTIIDEVKPDVLHHHNIAGLGPFVLGIKAPKVLYTAHDYWLVCPMNGLTRYDQTYCTEKSNCFMCSIRSNRPPQLWRYAGILDNYLKNIDTIITPSNFMKDTLQKYSLDGHFVTIPNFVPKPPKTGAPRYDFPYFLFVGVLEEHKGILNLVDAFLDVKDEIDAKLLIVGTGSLEGRIKNDITKNECANQIMMLGKIDDLTLANAYANALAVVIPSIWPENCPLVALEALANGTPIIVSDKGGLPEIVHKSKAGIITKANEKSLTGAMINLFKNTIFRDTLANNACASYESDYSKDVYLEKYLKLLH
jgi:glycosyltransferase involved in cell wall biosynthesis